MKKEQIAKKMTHEREMNEHGKRVRALFHPKHYGNTKSSKEGYKVIKAATGK